MAGTTAWTVLGPRRVRPRGSMLGMALAFLFAWPVMTTVPARYPAYMVVLALVAAGWFTYLGIRARAMVSLLLPPVALLWLNPLLGADWFSAQGPRFFLPHAAIAMLFGIAAYTYAASDRG